jgi:hypothetical protein
MTTDLEQRLHDELHDRARDAGAWARGGATLRRAAADRRTRRLRAGGAVAAVVVVAGVIAASLTGGGTEADQPPVVGPTPVVAPPPVDTTQPDPAWLQVPLSNDMYSTALAAAGLGNSYTPVVSVRLSESGRVGVLLAEQTVGNGLAVTAVTLDSSEPGATAVSGTSGRYTSWSSLVAQPVRDGRRTLLLVLVPPKTGDTVIATSSQPGRRPVTNERFVDHRLAVLAATAPDAVTRVQVLREGRTVIDTIPASSNLRDNVPRTLARVVATSGGPPSQPVQVRTDGRTACRLTVGGWWDGPPHIPWNPFDDACAPVDGGFHLLIAADRRYSSVAGLAPPGTTSVRLYWRSGSDDDVSEVQVTTDAGVTAFVDSSGHRPDNLLRAEAIRAGDVIATATP